MCCFFVALLFFGARVGFLIYWLLAPVRVNLALQNFNLPWLEIYAEQERLDDAATLYAELLAETPRSRTLLRNAAMLADRRGVPAEAAEYWARLAVLQEVATPGWYEARLAAAKGLLDSGQADRACESVREVERFRPDLRDDATKKRFAQLASSACGENP